MILHNPSNSFPMVKTLEGKLILLWPSGLVISLRAFGKKEPNKISPSIVSDLNWFARIVPPNPCPT